MIRYWQGSFALTLVFLFCLFLGSDLVAQSNSPVMNVNTHGGKYKNGGVGVGLFMGLMNEGSLYRGEIYNDAGSFGIGNGDAVDGKELDRSDSVQGISFDFQFGSNEETIGTDLGLDITSYSVESSGVKLFSANVVTFGADFLINFYKSEFLEIDGRRTRDGYGMSLIIGPKLKMLMGDLEDINGLASYGLDLGFAFDIPVHEDILQISPATWVEVNYHTTEDFQADLFVATDSGTPTGTLNFDGVVVRSHTLIPSFAWNLGLDAVLTPLFVGRQGNLINNWRFNLGLFATLPITFNAFAADLPGDPLKTDRDGSMYVTASFGVAYFW